MSVAATAAAAACSQELDSVVAGSALVAFALRVSASSSPIRSRWRRFSLFPLRGVANQTWRSRTFQIARLLISQQVSKGARSLCKEFGERKRTRHQWRGIDSK